METLYGTVDLGKGFYIEESECGVCFALPERFKFEVGTRVRFTTPNPTPGAFIEDFHDQVIHVEQFDGEFPIRDRRIYLTSDVDVDKLPV